MKHRLWINFALAIVVSVLVWTVFFKQDNIHEQGYALSKLDAASVNEIILAPANRPRIVLAKRKGEWFVTEPFLARADSTRIDGLLGLLTARSEKRLPANDLARFQLDQPLVRARIGTQEFVFGGSQPLSNQLYVLTEGAVYLISPVYFVDVAKPAPEYISKALLSDKEIPVAFDFTQFKLNRIDGNWRMTPETEKFSQDQANAFADAWQHAIANAVLPMPSLQSGETLKLKFKSGLQSNISVLREADKITLWRSDEKLAYQFPLPAGQALLTPSFAAH